MNLDWAAIIHCQGQYHDFLIAGFSSGLIHCNEVFTSYYVWAVCLKETVSLDSWSPETLWCSSDADNVMPGSQLAHHGSLHPSDETSLQSHFRLWLEVDSHSSQRLPKTFSLHPKLCKFLSSHVFNSSEKCSCYASSQIFSCYSPWNYLILVHQCVHFW